MGDENICQIEGIERAATTTEVNRMAREMAACHLRPMKHEMANVATIVKSHVEECAVRQAKLEGGIFVLKLMATGVYALIAGLFAVIAHKQGWL